MNAKHELTQAGYDKKKERLKFLKEVAVPRNIEALKEARAQGDLSENAEYEAARDEQSQIAAEIAELENIIENAIIIQSSDAKITVYFEDDDIFGLGDAESKEDLSNLRDGSADNLALKKTSSEALNKAILLLWHNRFE